MNSALESRIFRILTGTRVQSDIPGAILAEIGQTHYLLERSKALHLFNVLMAANKSPAAMYLHGALGLPEDEPITAVKEEASDA